MNDFHSIDRFALPFQCVYRLGLSGHGFATQAAFRMA